MERHDDPHDRGTCARCLELRRQEFMVPVERRRGFRSRIPAERSREIVHRWVDPDEDREMLWGEAPGA